MKKTIVLLFTLTVLILVAFIAAFVWHMSTLAILSTLFCLFIFYLFYKLAFPGNEITKQLAKYQAYGEPIPVAVYFYKNTQFIVGQRISNYHPLGEPKALSLNTNQPEQHWGFTIHPDKAHRYVLVHYEVDDTWEAYKTR